MPPKKPPEKPVVEFGWQIQEVLSRVCRASSAADWATAGWVPPVDCAETQDAFLVFLELPGVARPDIRVEVEGGYLRVCGQKREFLPEEVSRIHHVEIDRGRFRRVVPLPPGFDGAAVEARLRNGVLAIRVRREEPYQGRVEIEEER